MKFDYKFSNLCGTLYKQGNLLFTPDGNSVLSPVGNRISVFDLVNHKSFTLPFQNRKNISRLALSPNGHTLLSIDEDGGCLLINLPKRVQLCHFNFKKPVRDAKFSPDSQYIAVTHGKHLQVWKSPALITQFSPFMLLRTYTGHHDDILSIEWTPDSQFLITSSKDLTARVYSLHPTPRFVPLVLAGHRDAVVGAFFSHTDKRLFTVGKDGALFAWSWIPYDDAELAAASQHIHAKKEKLSGKAAVKYIKKEEDDEEEEDQAASSSSSSSGAAKVDEDTYSSTASSSSDVGTSTLLVGGRFKIEKKHYFNQNSKVTCASLHRSDHFYLLVVGFANGLFGLYELPDATLLHSLSISQHKIHTVTVNPTGEWLAFGAGKLGQLLVWEWQSETYVLKQQGHFFDVNSLAYSPDGQLIATGADDGKVKLWNSSTGFCFVTFSDHSAPVTNVAFSHTGTVVFSASSDGTVRAYDLVRYRNFRIMSAPTPVQFSSLAVDPSGEIVCAGGMEPFEVYVWSLQTGRLLDVLPGHEGPISCLAFNPVRSILASCSWDKSVRMWDVFEGHHNTAEKWSTQSECLALAFRPDGKEVCIACLDGQLYFFDVENGTLKFTIEGRKDVQGGRRMDDARAASNSTHNTAFTSLCYTADGTCVLAGGNSKFVCIYEVAQKLLLRKFVVSHNQSFDGLMDKLNSRFDSAAGNLGLLDLEDEEDDLVDRLDKSSTLPGASKGEFSERKTRPVIRIKCVRFSANGRSWAAASTEGLLIYSLDDELTFDPFDLDIDITPLAIQQTIDEEKNFSKALVMALRLNEKSVIREVLEQTPTAEMALVARSLPIHHLNSVMSQLSQCLEASPHLEFYLLWTQTLLTIHGSHIRKNYNQFLSSCRGLQKSLTRQQTDLAKICHDNQYQLEYLSTFGSHRALAAGADDSGDDSKQQQQQQLEFVAPTWAAQAVPVNATPAFHDDDDDAEVGTIAVKSSKPSKSKSASHEDVHGADDDDIAPAAFVIDKKPSTSFETSTKSASKKSKVSSK